MKCRECGNDFSAIQAHHSEEKRCKACRFELKGQRIQIFVFALFFYALIAGCMALIIVSYQLIFSEGTDPNALYAMLGMMLIGIIGMYITNKLR